MSPIGLLVSFGKSYMIENFQFIENSSLLKTTIPLIERGS
jgi:hypothetical protein